MNAKDTLNLKQFPCVVVSDCRNIRHIYPLKQNQVARIYDIVRKNDIVHRVIIFGSSITGKCHIDSDLDICIDANVTDGMKIYELQKQIGEICDWNCDILMYSNLGSTLKDKVDQEGVVIYE
mgnify:FL=1